MSNQNMYYLARSGKIAGPYTEGDLQTLESRGELLKYAWIWSPGATDWKALDPKPTRSPSFDLGGDKAVSDEAISSEAYALWGQTAIRGRVESRTELGFELVYSEKRMAPALAKGMTLQVMQTAEASGDASLVSMKISEIVKKGEQWVLFLRHQ